MKKLVIFLALCLNFSIFEIVIANSGDIKEESVLGNTINKVVCKNDDFEIIGLDKVKIGTSQEYVIKSKSDIKYHDVSFELNRDGIIIDTAKGEKYLRYFTKEGKVKLSANFISLKGCEIKLEKDIKIYKSEIVYIGSETNDISADIDYLYENKLVLFKKIILNDDIRLIKANEGITDIIYGNIDNIKESDIIIMNTNDPNSIFSIFLKIISNPNTNISLEKKKIYIVSDMGKNLAGKLLAQHIKSIGVQDIYVLQNRLLLNLLFKLGENKYTLNDEGFNKIGYDRTPGFLSLNNLVYNMIYGGFPASILGFILSLSIAILLLNFLKHVVGIYSFGIYNPIFLSICLSIMEFKLFIILILLAFISTNIVNLLLKKIYLLYNAKRSLLITMYLIMTIIFFGTDNYFNFNIIDYSLFSNIFMIFPFLFIILIADKIFHEDINIFSKSGSILFLQFLIISIASFYIINSLGIQYTLLSYPDLLFIIALLNILIGRFTGLQLFEYFRFYSLFKSIDSEE
ncbi:MAG: 7TM domain-containing protein [Candidatus Gracilibacteria bacterium]|nr:7TM domain-containing protein [Candidatus Gracilibacteria bacterium]